MPEDCAREDHDGKCPALAPDKHDVPASRPMGPKPR